MKEMKTKIKDAIVEYFKSQFENRKDINLTTSDLADICYDVNNVIDHVNVWNVINPDDESTFPDDDRYVLMSFENFSIPCVGRYHRDKAGGAFYVGDDDESCSMHGVIVNAWAELQKCYKGE